MKFHDIDQAEPEYDQSPTDGERENVAWIHSEYVHGGKCYYKLYPAIYKSLSSIKLDVPLSTYWRGQLPIIGVRLASGSEFVEAAEGRSLRLQTMLFGMYQDGDAAGMVIRSCAVDERTGLACSGLWWHRLCDESPMNEFVCNPSVRGADALTVLTRQCEKIAILVYLLSHDSELVLPEILSRDEPNWKDATPEQREVMVARAKRKGKFGFSIGKEYETMPHFRRPHFALRHTGKGGAIPKIVPVKSSIVHREVLTRVPTGHYDANGNEVEPKS
jgi:hypothetical protein